MALKVKGEGTGTADNNVGSGVALWITKGREKPGTLYGSAEKFNGIGVFFDSFDNDNKKDNPIIMGTENDGTKQFNAASDHQGDRFGGCRAKYRNRGSLVRVKIKYVAGEDGRGHIQMWLSMKDNGHFDVCFAKDGIKLDCGTSKTGCRIGFSASNLPAKDARVGDMVSVSQFKLWDLSEKEYDQTRRELAERDRIRKRNEMHPDLQEFLVNYDTTSRGVVDQLMENIVEEVTRDRQTKHNEFADLHRMINSTLSLKGPITKYEVQTLLASVKQVKQLATQAKTMLQELRDGGPALKSLTESGDAVAMSLSHKNGNLVEIQNLQANARRGHANSARALQEAASAQESSGWLFYVVCVQVVVVVGLVAYKKAPPKQEKSHCV